jgi:hypothetical protein
MFVRTDTSVGTKTCHHGWSPGSFGYYEQDAVRSSMHGWLASSLSFLGSVMST